MHLLAIADHAAIVAPPGEEATAHGLTRGSDAIPAGLRRRMSRFELNTVRCALGLARPDDDETMILASRYGGMETAYGLLQMLVADEVLSPADFSVCVHNAAPALASQIIKNRAGHSAVAADRKTFAAGLTEAAARLADGERSVLLLFAEQPLPEVYAEVEDADDPAQIWLAVRLTADTGDASPVTAGSGRSGARQLIAALDGGARRIAWRP